MEKAFYSLSNILWLSQALDTLLFIHWLEAVWLKKKKTRWLKVPTLIGKKNPGTDTPCFTHYLPTKAGSYE